MSAAWHQLYQNKMMSPALTSFQPSAGVEYASAGLLCFLLFFCFKVRFSDVNVLSLCNSVYSKCVLMSLAASSKECGMVFDCISV